MQRTDSLDSPKNKFVFKKRNHRPWGSSPTEQAQESLNLDNPTSEHPEFSSIALQQTTSETLTNSIQTSNASNLDLNRLLIGGFAFPNTSLNGTESENLQKSNALMNELKTKEQEIEALTTNIKIATVLEQAERIELARKKEALARKAAEDRALSAIQKAKLTEESLQKAKVQIQIEQQLKYKEENIRKTLELEIKNALRAIEENELAIAREIEARQIAEEKLNETLKFISEKEYHIRLEAEKTIKDNLKNFIEREKNIEQVTEDRINTLQVRHKEEILKIQDEATKKITAAEEEASLKISQTQEAAAKKIADAEEKVYFHKKAKIETQKWLQKSMEATRQIEAQKNEIENNLNTTLQHAAEQKMQYESEIKKSLLQIHQLDEKIASMAILNVELKQKLAETESKLQAANQAETLSIKNIESLNLEIQQLTQKTISLEADNSELTKLFTDTLGKLKTFQGIAKNENQLRIMLEEKLSGSTIRRLEFNKKQFENKILELTQKVSELEIEKAQIVEKSHDALENVHRMEILMASETSIKNSLEDKNKLLMEQIYNLEHAKQKEVDEKSEAEYKISTLISEKQYLEQEKAYLEEKYRKAIMQTNELESILANEKTTSEKLEKTLAFLTKQQQNLEQEKSDIEQKFNTTLTLSNDLEIMLNEEKSSRLSLHKKVEALSCQLLKLEQEKTNIEKELNTALVESNEREIILNNEKTFKLSLEKKIDILSHQLIKLEQEKSNFESTYNTLLTKATELEMLLESEKSLRKEAERLKTMEENARKAAQEKISSAMEQANKTVLTVLGNYTTKEIAND